MAWFTRLTPTRQAIVVLLVTFVAGATGGLWASGFINLPEHVAAQDTTIANMSRTLGTRIGSLENVVVYHICETQEHNKLSNGSLATCIADTKREVTRLNRLDANRLDLDANMLDRGSP